MTKLTFGCGYLGERVARQWHEAGQNVSVVTRRLDRAAALVKHGFRAIVADVTQPDSLQNLPHAETVLFSVGYDRSNSHSIEEVYAGGVKNVLNALAPGVNRFIYISTTGVYGSSGGDWVDENTPPDPQREGGKASLAAETVLAAHPIGANSVILRLAGIYGPGRVPFIHELRAARPIPAPIHGHLNLIHVDDAASVVLAADHLPGFRNGPRIYCVSDGQPVERGDFYREVARQIGAQLPAFVEPEPNSPRAARAAANRRILNAYMLRELQIALKYPDYRAGLAATLET
jgi:nucleoside-diphosphate-sugar epimerase